MKILDFWNSPLQVFIGNKLVKNRAQIKFMMGFKHFYFSLLQTNHYITKPEIFIRNTKLNMTIG